MMDFLRFLIKLQFTAVNEIEGEENTFYPIII